MNIFNPIKHKFSFQQTVVVSLCLILIIEGIDINRRSNSVFLSHFEVFSEVLVSAPVSSSSASCVGIFVDTVEVGNFLFVNGGIPK